MFSDHIDRNNRSKPGKCINMRKLRKIKYWKYLQPVAFSEVCVCIFKAQKHTVASFYIHIPENLRRDLILWVFWLLGMHVVPDFCSVVLV